MDLLLSHGSPNTCSARYHLPLPFRDPGAPTGRRRPSLMNNAAQIQKRNSWPLGGAPGGPCSPCTSAISRSRFNQTLEPQTPTGGIDVRRGVATGASMVGGTGYFRLDLARHVKGFSTFGLTTIVASLGVELAVYKPAYPVGMLLGSNFVCTYGLAAGRPSVLMWFSLIWLVLHTTGFWGPALCHIAVNSTAPTGLYMLGFGRGTG